MTLGFLKLAASFVLIFWTGALHAQRANLLITGDVGIVSDGRGYLAGAPDVVYGYSGLKASGSASLRLTPTLMTDRVIGFYGDLAQLQSKFIETGITRGQEGTESIRIAGGGGMVALYFRPSPKPPLFVMADAGIGAYSATISQTGESAREQTYPLGIGFKASAGFGLGLGKIFKPMYRYGFFFRAEYLQIDFPQGLQNDDLAFALSRIKVSMLTYSLGLGLTFF